MSWRRSSASRAGRSDSAGTVDEVINAFGLSSLIESHYRYQPDDWCNSSKQESGGAMYRGIHARRDYDPDIAAESRAVVCLERRKQRFDDQAEERR